MKLMLRDDNLVLSPKSALHNALRARLCATGRDCALLCVTAHTTVRYCTASAVGPHCAAAAASRRRARQRLASLRRLAASCSADGSRSTHRRGRAATIHTTTHHISSCCMRLLFAAPPAPSRRSAWSRPVGDAHPARAAAGREVHVDVEGGRVLQPCRPRAARAAPAGQSAGRPPRPRSPTRRTCRACQGAAPRRRR